MTPELEQLRGALGALQRQVDDLSLELVENPDWEEPSDTSYLNDRDRADPHIMANVEAMLQTNRHIAWFGRDADGYLGLWRGPHDEPLETAPVVRLDTEGTYDVLAATIADYIAIAVGEDTFDATRNALGQAGFDVSQSPEAVWKRIPRKQGPNVFRSKLYNEGLVRRGLDPVE